jgi:hypothetical protein
MLAIRAENKELEDPAVGISDNGWAATGAASIINAIIVENIFICFSLKY